jgi:hypothetical protein
MAGTILTVAFILKISAILGTLLSNGSFGLALINWCLLILVVWLTISAVPS